MTSGADNTHEVERLDRRRLALSVLAISLFLALSLFLPAGTLAWMNGWRFLLVFLGTGTLAGLYLWRVNRAIFVARSRMMHEGTKSWDRMLLRFLIPAIVAIPPVAALDSRRFHWCPVPWCVCALGYFLLLLGMGITAWAQAVNKFFEPSVRIQTERGHRVIDAGPYAIVRHPGYVAGCLLTVGTALSLGSLWALVPASLAALLLLVRTWWEDQTLQGELVGYRDYAQRVRFKWIPGLW